MFAGIVVGIHYTMKHWLKSLQYYLLGKQERFLSIGREKTQA
jgi:hypothetical protein